MDSNWNRCFYYNLMISNHEKRKPIHLTGVLAMPARPNLSLFYHARCFFATVALLGSTLALAEGPKVSEQSFCVQTFNAYGPAYAPSRDQRTLTLGKELELSPCQIIQLQEVWQESHHDLLLRSLSGSLPFMSAARFDHFQTPVIGNSGLAIFTSEFLSGQVFEAFTLNTDGMMDNIRSMLGVIKGIGSSRISLRTDQRIEIHMLNVHLHPSSQAVRVAQILQLVERLNTLATTGAPVILTGDFNFRPNSVEYELLWRTTGVRDSYYEVNGDYASDACTYCENNPHHWAGLDGVIDYIWVRNGRDIRLKTLAAQINLMGVNGITPSDHYGIKTIFEAQYAANEPSTALEAPQTDDYSRAVILKAIQILDAAHHLKGQLSTTKNKLLNLLKQNAHERQNTAAE